MLPNRIKKKRGHGGWNMTLSSKTTICLTNNHILFYFIIHPLSPKRTLLYLVQVQNGRELECVFSE